MKIDRLISPSDIQTLFPEIEECARTCKGRVHILVEPEKRIRSTGPGSQGHHLNGHIQQIAMFTGQPFEDIKKYVKQRAIDMGYPMLKRLGQPVVDLWGQPVGISEADSTTAECALLIEQTHILASELGIILREGDYGL